MRWKVCGMLDSENIQQVSVIEPDFMGFIFFASSPRNADRKLRPEVVAELPTKIKKVGVFVNADEVYILDMIKRYRLDLIQLHGNESPLDCFSFRAMGFPVIKAFGIDESFDWSSLEAYTNVVDYFLFDTKGRKHGGNGVQFDWQLLKNYNLTVPFFLSGGLSLESIDQLRKLPMPHLYAIDVNSRFELAPAIKDVQLLNQLKEKLSV